MFNAFIHLRLVVYSKSRDNRGRREVAEMFSKNLPVYSLFLPVLTDSRFAGTHFSVSIASGENDTSLEKGVPFANIEMGIFATRDSLSDLKEKLSNDGWEEGN